MNAQRAGAGPARTGPQHDGNFWFFWSLGNVVGFARRLLVGDVNLGAPRRMTDKELLRLRRETGAEVSRLESDLDRLHKTIASGVVGGGGEGSGGLPSMIDEARRLRDRLQHKQEDLVRFDRHLARERRLQTTAASRRESAGDKRERARAKARKASGPRRPKLEQRRKAAARIVRSANHPSRSAAVSFRTFADELFVDNPERRRAAVGGLSQSPSKHSLALLKLALDDEHERVQLAALNAVANMGGKQAAKECRRFLRHAHAPLRLAALRGLGDALTEEDIKAALGDRDERVRRASAELLGRRRDKGSLQLLTFALGDEEPAVRIAAAQALGNRGDHAAAVSLFRLLDDEVASVRQMGLAAARAVAGSEVDEVIAGVEQGDRVEALKRWWRSARIDKVMERRLGPREPIQPVVAPTTIEETVDDGPRAVEGVEDFETGAPEPAAAAGLDEEAAGLDEATPDIGLGEDEEETPDIGLGGDEDEETDLGLDDATPDIGLGGDEDEDAETPDLGLGGDEDEEETPDLGLDDATPDIGLGGDDEDEDAETPDLGLGGDDEDEDDEEYESVL